jgi:hypothetical protein
VDAKEQTTNSFVCIASGILHKGGKSVMFVA